MDFKVKAIRVRAEFDDKSDLEELRRRIEANPHRAEFMRKKGEEVLDNAMIEERLRHYYPREFTRAIGEILHEEEL